MSSHRGILRVSSLGDVLARLFHVQFSRDPRLVSVLANGRLCPITCISRRDLSNDAALSVSPTSFVVVESIELEIVFLPFRRVLFNVTYPGV